MDFAKQKNLTLARLRQRKRRAFVKLLEADRLEAKRMRRECPQTEEQIVPLHSQNEVNEVDQIKTFLKDQDEEQFNAMEDNSDIVDSDNNDAASESDGNDSITDSDYGMDEECDDNGCNSDTANDGSIENDEIDNHGVDNDPGHVEQNFVQESEEQSLMDWALKHKIPHTALSELLLIIKRKWCPRLAQTAKTFLGTSGAMYDIKEMKDSTDAIGEFVYLGIKQGLLECVNIDAPDKHILNIFVNIDGLQLFKSSSQTFWPILGLIHSKHVEYKPFVIAIYSGKSKPKNSHEYLREFVEEINVLQKDGILISGVHFKVHLKGFICDTPARAFIKSTVAHTAFQASERCDVVGKKVDKTTIYRNENQQNCKLRTDESFRTFECPDHHTGISLLTFIAPPINMISSVILDFMHLGFLGVMKKILEYLTTNNLKKVSQTSKDEISRRLECFRLQIPDEFPRKCRSLRDFSRFKATEYKLIAFYLGIIIFKKILNEDIYNHFLLFCVGSRLLWSPNTALQNTELAQQYLRQFFNELPEHYDSKASVLNMHHLIHVTEDVISTGCSLSEITAFPFENHMTVLKRMIRSPNKPLAQFCRRLHEQSKNKKPALLKSSLSILKMKQNEILKLKYKQMILSTKSPNNVVILKNTKIVEITKMYKLNDSVIIEGNILIKKKPIFTFPLDSSILKMWEIGNNVLSQTFRFSINNIASKAMKLCLNFVPNGRLRTFIIPLIHE